MALAGPAHALSDHQRQFVADVVQHGGVNADGMINGETQKTLAYLVARIQPKPPGPLPSTYAPSAWASMVDDYLITLAAAGAAGRAPVRHRRALLCRIARGLGCPPEQVTAEKLIDWFGRQQHWSPETRHSYRSVIRGSFWLGGIALAPAVLVLRGGQVALPELSRDGLMRRP